MHINVLCKFMLNTELLQIFTFPSVETDGNEAEKALRAKLLIYLTEGPHNPFLPSDPKILILNSVSSRTALYPHFLPPSCTGGYAQSTLPGLKNQERCEPIYMVFLTLTKEVNTLNLSLAQLFRWEMLQLWLFQTLISVGNLSRKSTSKDYPQPYYLIYEAKNQKLFPTSFLNP